MGVELTAKRAEGITIMMIINNNNSVYRGNFRVVEVLVKQHHAACERLEHGYVMLHKIQMSPSDDWYVFDLRVIIALDPPSDYVEALEAYRSSALLSDYEDGDIIVVDPGGARPWSPQRV